MDTTDPAVFAELAQSWSVIPLVRRRLADFETPIALAARLDAVGDPFFLLESVEGGETWGRWSILGFGIEKTISIENGAAVYRAPGEESILPGNPVDALQGYLAAFRPYEPPGLPPFFGGAVGYFAFEAVRHFERCGETRGEVEGFPEAHFLMADSVAVFDNVDNVVSLVQCVHPAQHESPEAALAAGLQALDAAEERLFGQPIAAPESTNRSGPTPAFESNMSAEAYKDIVAKAKRYIKDGDVIQVVLAQHFSSETTAAPLDLYRALRYVNPSPYLFYLRLDGDRAIAGSSPEVMVRVDEGKAHIRPIAGTRPRGATPEEDRRHAEELLADPKERAEHVMLVDLARNDLGRIAVTGSVVVKDYMVIEHYSHVMHIVSDVEADVRDECDALDVFKASFPAGTLSGAPKVRAMEIIHELEPDPRGPYGGALGYLGYGGENMDMAITIRTLVYNQGAVSVTAGAGIVHDSVPEMEYQETLHKSQGMKRAVALAERGLRLDDREAGS